MRRLQFVCWSVAVLLLTTTAAAQQPVERSLPPASKAKVDYRRDVEPIFRSRCYSCHGAEQQEGGLRLDVRERALQGGDGGKVIVPGRSGESRLIRAVAGLDEELGIMPPEGEGKPLAAEEIAVLRAWIDQGASWPEGAVASAGSTHWSFQPIGRPRPPAVAHAAWVRGPIDNFVVRRLEEHGVEPSPEAARHTILRRLYLDLIGLPPTPDQVDAFLHDTRPDAVDRVVDRLLASPHYGERWARHWLDLARYADSDGYEKDRPRPFAWRYRQWVIDALNVGVPFDQFTIEQIAGDLLPDAATDQLVAVGFHRNTLHNTEGGIDPEEDRVKKTVDRTNTVATIWLGLTLGCAQCHSHKYDPITQREYYSMYAFFNNIDEVDVPAPTQLELARYEKAKRAFDAEQARLQQAVRQYMAEQLPQAQREWEARGRSEPVRWQLLEPARMKSARGATLSRRADGAIVAGGKNEKSDVYSIEARSPLAEITAIRLEALPDESLPRGGPGRADNGNFVLATIRVTAQPAGAGKPEPVRLIAATADYSQPRWSVEQAINENAKDGWAVGPRVGQRHVAVFLLDRPLAFSAGTQLTIELDQTYDGAMPHNLGCFRLSVTDHPSPLVGDGLPDDVLAALQVHPDRRTEAQRKRLAEFYASIDPQLARLRAAVAEHASRAPQPPATKAQSVKQTAKPRQTRVHIRGDFLNPGDLVEPRGLSVLPPIAARSGQPDRLDLARWLVGPDNPLTARVTVNRIWQRYFGQGLVATSDDFGSQGERPSHPELLDWLASTFRDSGWDLKRTHRLIVLSATYRQASALRPKLLDLDPQNKLLARQKRLRVEAEIIRDLALAVSGLLDPRVGGPSVRPPQPADYAALTYANSAKWVESKGGRSVSARPVYIFPAHIAVPDADDVRLPGFDDLHCATAEQQHAAAGTDVVERRGVLGVRPGVGASHCGRLPARSEQRGSHSLCVQVVLGSRAGRRRSRCADVAVSNTAAAIGEGRGGRGAGRISCGVGGKPSGTDRVVGRGPHAAES